MHRLAEGDAEAAVAGLSAASSENADDISLHFATALVAWHLGDIAKALFLARQCFDRDPGNGTFAEVLASLHAQSGDMLDSLYYGKLATALKPDETLSAWLPADFPSFGKAFLSIQEKPLLAQSRLLIAGGKLALALDKARQHVEIAPDDDDGRLFYGTLLLRAGRAGAAVETINPLSERQTPTPPAASAFARALAAVGDAVPARQWHDRACAAAPDDATIAAARIVDAPWVAADELNGWTAAWLARFVQSGKAQHWRPAGDKLVIGYLVSHFSDPRDAAAVAAVARAHARPGAFAIGYGLGAQSWDENAMLSGAFDKWRDIAGLDPATLARTIAVDGVNVVIDTAGFAAPVHLQTLARVHNAVRVAWLGGVVGLERTIYDATIGPLPSQASTVVDVWHAGCGNYPLMRDWTRTRERTADAAFRFGSDASLRQIDARTVDLWRAVLDAAPKSVLLLRADDMASTQNIGRLVERFGPDIAARIDVVDAASADDFYRQVDVALAPATGWSARMAAEALACAVPVVALGGDGPYGALLRDLGMGDLVATTSSSYVALASALARGGDKLNETRAAVEPIAESGAAAAAEIAAAIERAARATLSKAAA